MIPDTKLYVFFIDYIYTNINTKLFVDDDEVGYSSNFDYEMCFDGTKRIYFDIGLKMETAEITFRTGFEFDGLEYTWKDLFEHDTIFKLTNRAIAHCYQAFTEFCETNAIPFSHNINFDDIVPEAFTKSIIEQYVNYRSLSDVDHAYLLNNVGIDCKTGIDTIVTIKSTFAIIDEILYLNTQFNLSNNRKTFSDIVPLPRYNTIKNNCMYINDVDVQLNYYDTIQFFICLGCALQMLVGDKSDMILQAIGEKGIDTEMIKTYLKVGTEIFAQLREVLRSSKARILNIEHQPDWNSIIQ